MGERTILSCRGIEVGALVVAMQMYVRTFGDEKTAAISRARNMKNFRLAKGQKIGKGANFSTQVDASECVSKSELRKRGKVEEIFAPVFRLRRIYRRGDTQVCVEERISPYESILRS